METRVTFNSMKQSDLRIIRQSEALEYITNQHAWTVYWASPLLQFSFEKSSLKKYETLFSKKLPGYSCQFSTLKGLPFSIPSLLINVTRNGTDIYNSILVSVSTAESEKEMPATLLLAKCFDGSKTNLVNKIHDLIERSFRCQVRLIHLSEHQTHWLLGIALKESLRNNKSTSLSMTCRLPTSIPAEIDLGLDENSLAAIWDSFDDSESDVLTLTTVKKFFNETRYHFRTVYGIDISSSPIIAFSLKELCLKFSGKLLMRVKKVEILFTLLSYLASDCLKDLI